MERQNGSRPYQLCSYGDTACCSWLAIPGYVWMVKIHPNIDVPCYQPYTKSSEPSLKR